MQSGKIEVRIVEGRVLGKRFAIGGHRIGIAIHVFEQNRQIEREERTRDARAPVNLLGFIQLAFKVQETSQVDARLDVVLVQVERLEISRPGARGI